MDKNKQIAELLGVGCYIDYTSDVGKIAILREMRRHSKELLWKFLAKLGSQLYYVPIYYLLDDTGELRDEAIEYLVDEENNEQHFNVGTGE
ncbi:MAG: hypothetical protein PHO27_12070 [Sulfuricurvum sp.]|jgi:hypothetical protein|nr:hypothetical protein [Sulfuricurvum sp.]